MHPRLLHYFAHHLTTLRYIWICLCLYTKQSDVGNSLYLTGVGPNKYPVVGSRLQRSVVKLLHFPSIPLAAVASIFAANNKYSVLWIVRPFELERHVNRWLGRLVCISVRHQVSWSHVTRLRGLAFISAGYADDEHTVISVSGRNGMVNNSTRVFAVFVSFSSRKPQQTLIPIAPFSPPPPPSLFRKKGWLTFHS